MQVSFGFGLCLRCDELVRHFHEQKEKMQCSDVNKLLSLVHPHR